MRPSLPESSLFLSQDWFALLLDHGLGSAHSHQLMHAGIHQLHLLRSGGRITSCANYYSPDFGFVNGTFPSSEEANALALQLRADGANQIDLRPLRADRLVLKLLEHALTAQGFWCDVLPVSMNWYLPCKDLGWADYLAGRPSRLRNTLRRCQDKLSAAPGFEIEIFSMEGDALQRALIEYERVYVASWKPSEAFPRFITELCQLTARRGSLRLGILRVNGEPAAAQIWLVSDQTASIYKLAYDSRFAKQGVGTVLTAALFKHVLDVDHVAEVDFLTGDDDYKAEWMTHKRPLVALLAFNRHSLSGVMAALRHFGPRWLKNKLKRDDC